MTSANAVLIVGAAGFFGRLLVSELLQFTSAPLIVAGRNSEALTELTSRLNSQHLDSKARLGSRRVDLADRSSITAALKEVCVAICAAGPYQNMPVHLPELCMEMGIPYIDMADDREFVLKVRGLARNHSSSAVCTGWSSMPALSAILVQTASAGLENIEEIHIQIAPGNKAPRSTATVASLLDSVGKQFKLRRNHAWQDVTGFDEPRTFKFPSPIGDKTGYLVDVPDHELFPALFNAGTVEFRVGAEIQILNEFSALAAKLRRAQLIKSWAPAAALLEKAVATIGFLGHDWGALGVEIAGRVNGKIQRVTATILAEHNGHLIPVMPAVVITDKLLHNPHSFTGLVPLHTWITKSQLEKELAVRNYKLVISTID